MRSNLWEYDYLWATGTKWSSPSQRKPGKACLVPDGSVLHIHKYMSWKVLLQLNTKQHVFTWGPCGTNGFGSAWTKMQSKNQPVSEDWKKDSHKPTVTKTEMDFLSRTTRAWLLDCLRIQVGFFSQSLSHWVKMVREDSSTEIAHPGPGSQL